MQREHLKQPKKNFRIQTTQTDLNPKRTLVDINKVNTLHNNLMQATTI